PNFASSYDVESAISSMEKGRYCGIDLWVAEDKATGLYGFLNYYGQWQIAPQYIYARSMNSDGFAIVEVSKGQWGAIDRAGNMVIAPNFNSSYDVESALRKLTR
ncbi:MAG: WG repeat-containing protein, partial [Alistipes sp.]|nr:WG repeat-containing protein [Alistipes sp.]